MNILSNKFIAAALTAGSLCATATMAAPQYPFPQQVTYKYGNTATYVPPSDIQSHFDDWKGAWYKDMGNGTARIITNDSTELSVSEGIAYGMLIMVYMSSTANDHQSEFDKLWAYWKKYAKSSGGGMNWKINNNSSSTADGGDGTATDADLDAATALIMAYKQWGNATYLSEAKTLINWIKSNDMESDGRVRPGSNWNTALNTSYVFPAAFQLFYDVTGESFWQTAITTNLTHMLQCQNATTGLMPDWCDWSSHKATNAGQVSGGSSGFYDDAARTPWRMAWGYYWYGIENAKAVNDKIVNWLNTSTYGNAVLIWPGYTLDGNSPYSMFVTSTYVGGLGLAMGSADNPGYYLESIYDALANTAGKLSPTDGKGESYYPATLNILYLLTMSGNLPNLYSMDGLTKYTLGSVRQPSMPEGTLQPEGSGYSISGYKKWGVFGDKLGVTKVAPDSGSSGLFLQANGEVMAALEFRIAPEPTYDATIEQEYPFAGLSLSLDENDGYHDLSDVAKIRINYKSQGVIRFAILDKATLDNDNEGGEPGVYLQPTEEFTTVDIDLSASNFSTDYFDFTKGMFVAPSWVSGGADHDAAIVAVRGFKFEPKLQKGGYGNVYIKQFDLYDAAGNVITTYTDPNAISIKSVASHKNGVSLNGNVLQYSSLGKGARIEAFDMNGNLVKSMQVSGSGEIAIESLVQNRGAYILRIMDRSYTKNLRIHR